MAGNLKIQQVQLGDSATAANNFVLSVPASPDGTLDVKRGDGTSVMNVASDGSVDFTTAKAIETPVKSALNASGDAPVYGCRAWVNFNGTGTMAIRASGNVSSITDNGAGDYTVNFTTALPDANYCAQVTCDGRVIGDANTTSAPTTTSVRVSATSRIDASGLVDSAYMNVAIFR